MTGIRRRGADGTVLIVMNSYHETVPFKLPAVTGGSGWRCLVDTTSSAEPEPGPYDIGARFPVAGRSLVLLELLGDAAYLEAGGAHVSTP